MGRHEVGQLLRHAPSTFCEGAKLRAFLRLGALALVVIDALVSGAYAQDISGAADHPLVPRYEGAEIVLYDVQAFTSYPLLTAPAVAYGGIAANPEATLPLEGRTTRISYRAPADRSVLEVFRNYEQALAEAGFEPIFTCAREECGGRNFNAALATSSLYTLFGEYHAEQHYFARRLQRPEGDVFVALYTVMNKAGGGPNRDRGMAQLDVVEVQPMEERMVVLDAGTMERNLSLDGRVALYGLLFDTDSDVMREESGPQLDEIAALLTEYPELEVLVVGHTDSQGSLDYNGDLSLRRAMGVVTTLTRDYGIEAARLTPLGVGMAAPVASNRTEAGRAKNRRVELVDRAAR